MLSDPDSRRSSIISESDETEEVVGITTVPEKTYPLPLNNLFSDNVYLSDPWHDDSFYNNPEDDDQKSTWRMKDKMKTAGVALVVCLNLGTDPPDVVKPNPCARKECWYDPVGPKQKGLEIIGNNLQQQYEKWQSKAKYKQCLDPTSEDLRRVCMNLRKAARNDRLLLHYNGHGVPRPTRNGELWVFGKHYTHYMPVAVCELRSWLGDPSIYVLDCSGAGALMPHFIDPVNHQHQGSADHSDNMSMAGGQFMYLGSASGSYANVNNHSGPYPAGNHAFGYGESKQFNGSRAQLAQEPSMSTMSNIGAHRASIEGQTIVLAACKANEILPMNPQYPADIFTSCLTTPIPIAVRWFILQNQHIMGDVPPDLSENLPGKDNDRKTPRGELNWIFTAITDTIAWNTLPPNLFQKMFRQDLLVASLFRNFLLAKRLMKTLNCTPQSYPPLPDSSTHPLWQAWDLATESCLFHVIAQLRGSPLVDPRNNMSFSSSSSTPLNGALSAAAAAAAVGAGTTGGTPTSSSLAATLFTSSQPSLSPISLANVANMNITCTSSFFTEHLTAFELWLDFGETESDAPMHLPILLQVLLSQTHRLRALQLLRRYLSLGAKAVNLSLVVGIFPYVLKLLQSPAGEVRQVLVSIWASIIGFDQSCRIELIRDKSQSYFIQYLAAKDMPPAQRCMAAFVLAEVCNQYGDGQQSCLQQSLQRTCTSVLANHESMLSAPLKQWVALCLFKLCEEFTWAKYLCLKESLNTQLYSLLVDRDVTVRAASILALGELFGASALPQAQLLSSGQADMPSTPMGSSSTLGLGSQTLGSMVFGGQNELPVSGVGPPPASPFMADGKGLAGQSVAANGATWIGAGAAGTTVRSQPRESVMAAMSASRAASPTQDEAFLGGRYAVSVAIHPEKRELLEAELLLAMQLLESCTDGAVAVRREAVIALSKFVVWPTHLDCVKIVAKALEDMQDLYNCQRGKKPRSASESSQSGNQSVRPVRTQEASRESKSQGPPQASSPKKGSLSSGDSGLTTPSTQNPNSNTESVASSVDPNSSNMSLRTSEPIASGSWHGKTSAASASYNSSASQPAGSSPQAVSTSNVGASSFLFPWMLTPAQSRWIADQVKEHLLLIGFHDDASETMGASSSQAGQTEGTWSSNSNGGGATPRSSSSGGGISSGIGLKSNEVNTSCGGGSVSNQDSGTANDSANPKTPVDIELSKAEVMAAEYVRLWLALVEVQHKDPHVVVANAAAAVVNRIRGEVTRDRQRALKVAKLAAEQILSAQSSPGGTLSHDAFRSVSSVSDGHPGTPAMPGSMSTSSFQQDGVAPNHNPWEKGRLVPPPLSPMGPRDAAKRRSLVSPTRQKALNSMASPTRGPARDPRGFAPSASYSSFGRENSFNGTGSGVGVMGAFAAATTRKPFGSQSPVSELTGQVGGAVGGGPVSNSSSSSSSVMVTAAALAARDAAANKNLQVNTNLRDSTGSGAGAGDIDPDEDIDPDLEDGPVEYEPDPVLTSYLYEWSRKLLLTPENGYDPYDDTLCVEGGSRLYRDMRLNDVLGCVDRLADIYRDIHDERDMMVMDHAGKEELQIARASMVAALPPAVSKFEQKAILNIDTAEMTSLVMFHTFHDILAISDGYSVGLWSLSTGTKIMQIPNGTKPSSSGLPAKPVRRAYRSGSYGSDMPIASYAGALGAAGMVSSTSTRGAAPHLVTEFGGRFPAALGPSLPATGVGIGTQNINTPAAGAIVSASAAATAAATAGTLMSSKTPTGQLPASGTTGRTTTSTFQGCARVTAMTWINESYDSLLMIGSDDGTVKVWKDASDSDIDPMDLAAYSTDRTAVRPSIYSNYDNNSEAVGTGGAILASAFMALPDIAEISRGSGLVFSWTQPTGTLSVGGNSNSIRIWDLSREQCVRVFNTGLDTCTTAIASRSISADAPSYSSYGRANASTSAPDGEPQQLVSWTFAGFADGSVAVFDERIPSTAALGGRVHCAREHGAWVVSAHLRSDGVPEVITGSVRGVVKFWDLRSMRTFKSFEVHKSPLTALAVHPCAPIMATGSHAQFIKILTLGGDQLGHIIKYHDGFLGQRIGPVSCLAFHPTRLMLAAGATDSIVSIYATAEG